MYIFWYTFESKDNFFFLIIMKWLITENYLSEENKHEC